MTPRPQRAGSGALEPGREGAGWWPLSWGPVGRPVLPFASQTEKNAHLGNESLQSVNGFMEVVSTYSI